MGWRTVVIANTAKLDYKMSYLVVRSGDEIHRIHISEISVLVIESTAVSLTAYLLCELANNKIDVIFCDHKRMPNGYYLPVYGSHDTSQKIARQVKWTDGVKAMIWRDVIRRKILGQASVLQTSGLYEAADKLMGYIPQIEDNDETNREGHAAKVYFNALFGKAFSRTDAEEVINAELNYGYAILLSDVCREIVCNGYITQIGIHHINQFNEYNLASDLMEPFRPFVDQYVIGFGHKEFSTEEKHKMAKLLDLPVRIDGKVQYLQNAVTIYVKSITDALCEGVGTFIKFPDYEFSLYESDSVL